MGMMLREKPHLGGYKYCNGLKKVEERLSVFRNTQSCFPEHESSGLGAAVFQAAHKPAWFSMADTALFDQTLKDWGKYSFV